MNYFIELQDQNKKDVKTNKKNQLVLSKQLNYLKHSECVNFQRINKYLC